MRIEPLGDQVVIKRLESAEKTTGGILLPEANRERPLQGRVLSVGSGRINSAGRRSRLQVNEGDRVVFSRYAGTEIEVNGEKLLIMAESEILATIE
ncbi:MAG: co-chaperone GroES [Pirellulaceae bacterium]